ncbi:hypothetical protein Q4Q34_08865 [Flavivirga abyssicola]|uniref:hypothetical protein n=1 Tax=Flavivirga abyssicola TaxID=3063533 RepID=UPI0026DF20F4|nr:hypothetical protein [Flavivirga sp. MEBiC07777]WVK15138.1 hypothetical protein Q4Q34_08865 [Flavivirga sp. MEBiC07777]
MREICFLTILTIALLACLSNDSNSPSQEDTFKNLNDVAVANLKETKITIKITAEYTSTNSIFTNISTKTISSQ